jgi:Acyl dehydratase
MRERAVQFTEEDVEAWCDRNDDNNPLHLDEHAASLGTFGERVVPGMMLLDHVSGMLTAFGDEHENVVLAGITAARFRDPILLGETVNISTTVADEDKRFTYVDFEARVPERGSLVANGTISILID